jgi:sulfite exporter TauE/SafE
MDLTLFLGALLLGAAGVPHCAAMCAPASGVLIGRCARHGQSGSSTLVFHVARIASYAAAGALVATSAGWLAELARAVPALRPLWTLLHAAALALGLWLAWQGRQPAWLENLGRGSARLAPQVDAQGWQRLQGPASAAVAGGLWAAWPCGLLQSALLVAALAGSAWGGAAVMAGFAATSAIGLGLAPWAFARLTRTDAAGGRASLWATRAGGVLLAAASAWALGQDLVHRVVAYCFG